MVKIQVETQSKDPKLGYYVVQNKIYWDKVSALIAATKLNLTLKDIHWNFNNDVYQKQDWLSEPPGNLKDYYYARARQLREKYDYIVINCSGGADSTTALFSFIDQGLHVDEIIIRYAESGTKQYDFDIQNYNASNEFSEFKFAAVPLMQAVKHYSPKTKITIHDFSKDILDDNLSWDENFIYWTADYPTPGCIVRYAHNTLNDSLKTFDKGKNVCIIFGTDKPKLVEHSGNLYCYFSDRQVSSAIPATVNNGWNNVSVELFYWSPDLPALVIKQAHIVKTWFERPENITLRHILTSNKQGDPTSRTTYETIIKGIIYPEYNQNTFQANKPNLCVLQEWDYWLCNYTYTKGYNVWKTGINFIKNNISESLVMGTYNLPQEGWQFHPCKSSMYLIGPLAKHSIANKIYLPYLNS
jgi:hypothetical protein